jgi:hypothetical protein
MKQNGQHAPEMIDKSKAGRFKIDPHNTVVMDRNGFRVYIKNAILKQA